MCAAREGTVAAVCTNGAPAASGGGAREGCNASVGELGHGTCHGRQWPDAIVAGACDRACGAEAGRRLAGPHLQAPDCAGGAAVRERTAAALWGHGADRILPDRGASS